MANNKNIALAGVVIVICVGSLFILLASSSVPVFSVKELMNHNNPESYIDRKIQLVGVVKEYNETHFSINDPQDTNSSLIIYIEAPKNVERPIGFAINKTVLSEGKLLSITGIWKFKASMISTKCPSKYES